MKRLYRWFTRGSRPMLALFLLLLVSLQMLGEATHNAAEFDRLYIWLLLINALGLVVLLGLIALNLTRLVRQYRARAPGSRLSVRLVVMFVLLSVAPVSVVYYFSIQFLQHGIDSWFNVEMETALADALELSRVALDVRKRELLRQTTTLAGKLAASGIDMASHELSSLLGQSEAEELALIAHGGPILASVSHDPTHIVPQRPDETIMQQVRSGENYVGLDASGRALRMRVVVALDTGGPETGRYVLQALYPLDKRMSALAESVQKAYARHRELAFLRQPLKLSFILTLSLVLLLSLLSAVWAAFSSARRLSAPIRDLAEGTRAVAAGDYELRLPVKSRDEMGFLVRSFNDMTRRIALARDAAQVSAQQAENERAYLEAVLAALSSGVLVLDNAFRLRIANAAAGQILGEAIHDLTGQPLTALRQVMPEFKGFIDALEPHLQKGDPSWREEEVHLQGHSGRRVLMCRGTTLPGEDDRPSGHVIVFNEITDLVQAQRNAAWGEVARRLAHEIKNPLTPIQLAAERLRRKYLKTLPPADAELLDRSTHTIIQQVSAMKDMVNAFSEYARAPRLQLKALDLNALIREVLDLYRAAGGPIALRDELDPGTPRIEADTGRMRQLLHNILKNAIEALNENGGSEIHIRTACQHEADCRFVEIRFEDDGPGFPDDMIGHIFDPYVTNKPRGTGLGLAIVKKIVEEHGGMISAGNIQPHGARIVIRLPTLEGALSAEDTTAAATAKEET